MDEKEIKEMNDLEVIPWHVYADTHVITKDQEDTLEKAVKHWDEYHQQEALIQVQVFMTIPKSLLIEVQKLRTTREV